MSADFTGNGHLVSDEWPPCFAGNGHPVSTAIGHPLGEFASRVGVRHARTPRQVGIAVGLPRTTVRRYVCRAAEVGLGWPLPEDPRLSHSAKAVHVAFASEGQEALLEGHVLAFDRLGGVPGRIRYDNLTPAVSRVLTGRGWSPSAPPTGSTFCCAGRMTWTWRPLPNSLHSQSSGVLLVAPPAASARADRRSAFFSGTTTLTDI